MRKSEKWLVGVLVGCGSIMCLVTIAGIVAAVLFFSKWKETDQHCAKAFVYREKSMWHEAIREYEEALAIGPDYMAAYYGLAKCYGNGLGDLKKAEETCWRALRIKPDYVNAYLYLGYMYYYKQDSADKAIPEYGKVLKIDPEDPYALTNLGIIYEKQGQKEKAIGYYQKAIDAHPDHWFVQTAKKNLGKLVEDGQEK